MLIYDVLKKDHEDARGLLARLMAAVTVPEKQDLVAQLRMELIPHARAEEKIFYDTLGAFAETEDLAIEGGEDHELIEVLLDELQALGPAHEGWHMKAAGLKETIERHIEHEESVLFEHARQVLAPEEAQMMAEAFRNLKQSVSDGSYDEIAVESMAAVAKFMPARFVQRFVGR